MERKNERKGKKVHSKKFEKKVKRKVEHKEMTLFECLILQTRRVAAAVNQQLHLAA